MIPSLMLLFALAQQPAMVSRVIEYEPGDAAMVESVARAVSAGVSIKTEPVARLISISGPEDKVKEAEELFRRYYKPKQVVGPKNAELTLHILLGKKGGDEVSDVPARLNPVVAQLRQATVLTSFRVVDQELIRVRIGEEFGTTSTMSWPGIPEDAEPVCNVGGRALSAGSQLQLEKMRITCRVPYLRGPNYNFREANIFSSFEIKPGQITVIGKTNASTKDGALIFVLEAKLVD